ncbi:MAG: type I restriction enzyme HsdR N-terminal domain-containing protein [Phycisphaerae bacterium]|nr:type I restriction enzyme HsdR N-terminal domain-containing protein [Phycisphaerae bacterium]
MAIPKRVADRIKSGLRTFRGILEDARNADRSEQDTVTIVTDMLADIFGYNKYSELTGEYAIRGTYCDLAVKIDGKLKYLIEVKSVDKSLKENHLRQATDYAAKEGIEWVALTNGIEWQAYRMIFEQPVRFEHVFTIDLLAGGSELPEMIYMLSREGIVKQALDKYHEQRQILNRHVVSAVVLSEPILKAIRRELRKLAPNMRIDSEEIKVLLTSEILKRDIVEGQDMKDAKRKVKRAYRRAASKRESPSAPEVAPPPPTDNGTVCLPDQGERELTDGS